MGIRILLLALAGICAIWAVRQYVKLRRNIKIAKTINLPYIIVPFFTGTILWFLIAPIIVPILRYTLLSCLTRKWIHLIVPFWTWYEEYAPFAEHNSDTIVTVAPGGITFHSCCPEFIRQIGERRRDFEKPLELYSVMNTFGPNLVSTNGEEWKHQRKIMSPSFNDAHLSMVWSETIYQTRSMIRVWSAQLKTLPADQTLNFQDNLRALAFNVVSRASFGVRMAFPGSESQEGGNDSGIPGTKPGEGYTMTFREATLALVEGVKWLFVFPKWVLKFAPFECLNHALIAYHEMGSYMEEYISNKQSDNSKSDRDQLQVGCEEKNLLNHLIDNNIQSSAADGLAGLTKQQIIGNVFNSLTAGHETSGSTLFLSLINLALHPTWQRKVQVDLDTIFGDLDSTKWCYKWHLDKLMKSSLDTTILESLRLYTPNNLVPKHSVERSGPPKVLKHRNIEVNVPANSRILTLMISTHRNPNYWHHNPSPTSASETDLATFKPERWFLTPSEAEKVHGHIVPLNALFADSPEAKAGKGFFKPERGAFIPWSIGNRECIGKKFAHIEILAALAMILKEWSVELVVNGKVEEGGKWEAESEKVKKCLRDGMVHYSTMHLGDGLVPLRIVKRGV